MVRTKRAKHIEGTRKFEEQDQSAQQTKEITEVDKAGTLTENQKQTARQG